jgi:hypothetical protein
MTAFNDGEAKRLNTAKSREKLYNLSPFRPGGFLTDALRSPLIHNFSRLGHPGASTFDVGVGIFNSTPKSPEKRANFPYGLSLGNTVFLGKRLDFPVLISTSVSVSESY